jgi:hypothetical protein
VGWAGALVQPAKPALGARCYTEGCAPAGDACKTKKNFPLCSPEVRNVTFYTRLGFAAVGEPEPYYTVSGVAATNYVMAREPPPGAALNT